MDTELISVKVKTCSTDQPIVENNKHLKAF